MSDTRPNPSQIAATVLTYLRQFKNDRGAMADLRRALTPAQRHRAWPLLARVNGIGDPRIELIAGLFAYHPDESNGGNLGSTCRELQGENNSFDARFRRLLGCDREEIYARLRSVILAAKAKGVDVNYEQLLVDLYYWGDRVKADWARQYWSVPEAAEGTAATGSGDVP
jgi:CRISPR system Cascade subunit CasB